MFTDEIVGWVPHGHSAEERGYLTAEDLEQEAFIYTQPDQDTEIDRLIGEYEREKTAPAEAGRTEEAQ